MAGQVNIGVNLDFTAQNLASIQKQLSSTIDAIEENGVKLGLSPETISQMKAEVSKLSESIVKNFNNTTGKINFDRVRTDLENAGVSAAGLGAKLQTVGVNGQSAFNSITKSAYTFEAKIKNTESLLYKFSQTLNNTIKWNISSSIVNQFSGEIQKAVYFTKDLDKSLNNIRIVSGASKDEMADFAIEANNAAKALRTSTVEYSDAALVYFQQGMAADDVRKMTEATVMGANIAGESTEEMSNLLTSTMNGYKMAADDALTVTDKLAAVGAETAADFYELATGMSKVASMANAAGIDIDQLNAQLATIVSVTKEAPESIGTSLKTIYGRMLAFQNNATDLMEDEDGELFGAPSVESALEKFSKATNTQISLFETTKDGTKVMRDLGDVMDEIGDAWQRTDNQAVKFGLSTALAGSRQQNRLVALFDSWDEYKDTVTTSLNAEGTTLKQNEVYMDSYAAHAKSLQASMESLYMELFNSDDMIGIVDILNEVIKGLTTIVDLLGGLPGVLGVISGLMTKTVFSKQLSGLASNLANKKIAEKFQGVDSAGVRQDGRNSSDYRKDETKYKDKLQTVSTVFKGEDFESVRKMTEELLKQKKQIEEVRASANLLNEAYKRTNSAITNSSASKGVFKSLQADAEGNVIATDRLNKKLQEFKTTYSANLTDTAAEELQDLEYNLNNSDIKLQDFIGQFKALISTMANTKAQNDLGLDTNFDELTQQLNQLEAGYEQNAQVLNETLDPMTEYADKINNIRNGISGAIPVLTTLFSVLGDDSKSAGEKALSVLTALGTALTFQMDTIIATTTAKMSEIAVTDLQTASEQGGIAAKLASAAAEASGTKATILGTAAKVAATVANGGLTASFYALASGIWAALAPILPFVAAIGGIVAVGYGLVKLFDALVVTEEELQEQSQEAADALTEVQNTISDLESNLKSLNDQINELDPITDADEIADLERQVSLTEAQLAAEKELEKVRAKEANQAQYDYLKKAYDTADNSTYNSETGGYEYKTDQEVYKDKITERQSIGKELKDKFDIQDISEIDQVIATKKVDLEKAIADGDGKLKKSLKEDIKELENYSDRYETLTNELAEETNNILSEVGKVDLSQLDENNEADKQIIKFIDSLKATAEQGLLELNPSDFIERLFDESDLTSIMDKLSSGGDISDILSKYEDAFSALGITTEEMTDYLQDYADAMQESETVVDDAQSQYDRLVNNINLLSKSYQDGETNLDDYTSGVYKNLEGLAQLADKTGEIKGDFSGTVNEFVGDLGEALGSLNDQYNSGALSIDDYIESAKNQVKQLLELKEVFPEIGDEIDALLNKNFDMDGITGLLDMDELVDGWSNTQDVISQVTAEFENLASVQELVADGFKISAEAASELANMYPQLLENAQTTADGQILLDEEVYNNFINSRQGMLAADIDSQIAQLEAKKAALEAAKAQAQAELELANAVASGEVDIENAKAQMLSTAEQNLTQYLIDLGVSEVDAQKAAAAAKAGNMREYERIVGEVADKNADNLANAMVAAANATKSNVQGMVSSLDALGKQSASVATQIGNMGSGKTTYSGPVVVGGGSAGGASFSASTSSGNFKGVTATAIKAAAPEMQSWTDRLNMNLSGYTQGIAQINAQISVLQGLKNRNANKNYSKNGGKGGKGGGGGGGSGSDTEEYIVELDKLKKAMQALADVQQEIEKNDTELDAAETSQEKYDLLGKKIELYDKERVALHNLADARRAVIKTNVEELRSKGFQVDYDPENHKLEIKNEEHINELKGKDIEATNELRKEMEELISTTEDLNDANKDTSQSWWENYYEQKDLLKERLDTEIEMYKEQLENERRIRNVSVQDIKDSYDDMINALKKAYDEGVISSEEFWDKLVEIGEEKMKAIRQDIENTIEHAKLIGRMSPKQEAAQWVAYRGQVNEMMALGQIGDYDDYISELEDIYEKIDSSLKEVYNNSVKNQEHAINILAQTAGTEEKQIAIYRNMMEETYNEAQRLRAKNYEANKETIQDLEEQWYSYYQNIIALQKQMLEKQQEDKESTVNAVVSVIDKKIQELEDQKDALSTLGELDDMLLDLKSDLLSADEDDKALIQEKIDYLEEQRDIYASLTDAEEKRLKMQEIEKALADITLKQLERKVELAKNNLVQRVWYEDKGWVWEADQSAINDAQKELNNFKKEMDQTDIDNEIDRLENYKKKWQDIVDDYKTEQDKLTALQELGADWEAKILDKRLDVLETFKDGYVDVLKQLNGLADIENGIGGEKMPDYTVDKGTDNIFGGGNGHVYDLEAKYYGYDGKGYNASLDYSQAIMDAKKRNASEEEILELKRVRNLKIKGEKMTQYYDSLDDFTEREKELLAQQSANVAENATSTGTSIASTIQNLQALDNQWTSTLDLTDPLKTYQTQLDELYEAEKKNYEQRLAAAEQFVKDYNATMAKMSSSSSGGIQISGGGGSSSGGVTYDKNVDYSAKIAEYKAQGAPASEIAKLEAQREAKIKGENLNPDGTKKSSSSSSSSSSSKNVISSAVSGVGKVISSVVSSVLKKKYASGGVNDYTGGAMLHGTSSSVETIFNAEDGKKLYDLVHNTKDLADSIAEDMVPYIPSLFENIGEIGFNPRNMMMPTVPKVEPQTIENDESTTFSNCKFEIKTNANNFEALVNDMEVKIKNR